MIKLEPLEESQVWQGPGLKMDLEEADQHELSGIFAPSCSRKQKWERGSETTQESVLPTSRQASVGTKDGPFPKLCAATWKLRYSQAQDLCS